MSIHLVGGGRAAEHSLRIYGPFVAEAVQRARTDGRTTARIGVVQLNEPDTAPGAEKFGAFADVLTSLGFNQPVPVLVNQGEALASGQLEGFDAVLVGGGLTPAYLSAVAPIKDELRTLVADGVPYLGFSAGAAIAAQRAIVGGWKLGDLVMCPEDNGEELDELTVSDGLGLVDFAVEVHAAQWGNLSRALLAVSSGAVDRAVALDESTVLVVTGPSHEEPDGSSRVQGVGQAWWIDGQESGAVTVRTEREPVAELALAE